MSKLRTEACMKRRLFLLFLTITMLLTACGSKERECAICGNPADKILKIENQKLDICQDCYDTYVEIQQLFMEIE